MWELMIFAIAAKYGKAVGSSTAAIPAPIRAGGRSEDEQCAAQEEDGEDAERELEHAPTRMLPACEEQSGTDRARVYGVSEPNGDDDRERSEQSMVPGRVLANDPRPNATRRGRRGITERGPLADCLLAARWVAGGLTTLMECTGYDAF